MSSLDRFNADFPPSQKPEIGFPQSLISDPLRKRLLMVSDGTTETGGGRKVDKQKIIDENPLLKQIETEILRCFAELDGKEVECIGVRNNGNRYIKVQIPGWKFKEGRDEIAFSPQEPGSKQFEGYRIVTDDGKKVISWRTDDFRFYDYNNVMTIQFGDNIGIKDDFENTRIYQAGLKLFNQFVTLQNVGDKLVLNMKESE